MRLPGHRPGANVTVSHPCHIQLPPDLQVSHQPDHLCSSSRSSQEEPDQDSSVQGGEGGGVEDEAEIHDQI